jgi:glycosyltransferase involved in cell wall biosynthesis
MKPTRSPGTLVCFSHLRWKFVYQRPQHLLSRAAKNYQVIYIEEPVFIDDCDAHLDVNTDQSGVVVVTPVLPCGNDPAPLLGNLLSSLDDEASILWFYTPLALEYGKRLRAELVVYDCMDELSAFKFASPALKSAEAELLQLADIVFTGGQSLYKAKRALHHNVHAFPSSVDAAHFNMARRGANPDPDDQAHIARPRLGFFGVIDERLDLELLAAMADMRPDWSFVMIGPVVKIDPACLPRRANIHWLGGRDYKELPRYLAYWDVGIMPFALNEATRFISPTKTPEFLAAGLPVVSSPITDVVRPYGKLGLVDIAATPADFVQHCEALLTRRRKQWFAKVDSYLAGLSWDHTWNAMHSQMQWAMRHRQTLRSTMSRVQSRRVAREEARNAGL